VYWPAGLPKELHFFGEFWRKPFGEAEIARYYRYFPRPPGMATGEWTPRYLLDVWTPPLLVRAAPEAKILVMLRDPIERYRSGVSHELDHGAQSHPVVALEAMARGLYGSELRHLHRSFPPEQVLVLQYERCCADPRPELRRTYRFLGLDDPDFVPSVLGEVVNPSRRSKVDLPAHIRDLLLGFYERDVQRLATEVPDLDLRLWPNFSHLATTS
jgi:hypothetical protein